MIKIKIKCKEKIIIGRYYKVKSRAYHGFADETVVKVLKLAEYTISQGNYLPAYVCEHHFSNFTQRVLGIDLCEINNYD